MRDNPNVEARIIGMVILQEAGMQTDGVCRKHGHCSEFKAKSFVYRYDVGQSGAKRIVGKRLKLTDIQLNMLFGLCSKL